MFSKILKNNFISILFFIAFFLYIWLRINPVLYYQKQEPVFLLSYNFFSNLMSCPGGFIEYLSAFLSQLYMFSFAGSLVITIIVLLICISINFIVKAVNTKGNNIFIYLFPAVLLLIQYNDYNYKIVWSLGILISLLFVNLYVKAAPKHFLSKILFYIFSGIILYYLTAGQFLLYFLLCLCIEIFSGLTVREKIIFLCSFILSISFIPFIAYKLSPALTLNDSYLGLLPFTSSYLDTISSDYLVTITSGLLYLFFVSIIVVPGIRKFYFAGSVEAPKEIAADEKEIKTKDIKAKKIKGKVVQAKKTKTFKERLTELFTGRTKFVFQVAAFFILTILAAYFTFDEKNKIPLLIDYYAQNERWEDVIKIAEKREFINRRSIYQTNRALFHLGQLSSNMFSYPQVYGFEGIVPIGDFMAVNTSLMGDVFFELGFLKPSEHWASDALTRSGETKQNLNRLFLINLLSGNKRFAQNCLNVLKETIFSKSLTENYQKYLTDDNYFRSNDKFKQILSCNIDTNYVYQSDNMIVALKVLLKKNLNNKMAFEYLMAYYLLNCNLGNLVIYLPYLKNLGYTELPRHYEEALLIYMAMNGINKNIVPDFTLNPSILQRFDEFRSILANSNGDLSLVKNELMERFGDTYWYYMVYHPATR